MLLASRQRDATAPGGVSTYHYHVDHLGTPRLVTNTSAAIIGRHDYLPFGPEVAGNNPNEPQQQNLKFTGHERDFRDHPPLDYMHARYYEPRVGRFLSVDPTWDSADLGKPQSWNRYSYVLNNPVTRIDPTGRISISAAVARARSAFWGSVDTGVDLGHFIGGTLPAKSAGTADEAANLAHTPAMQDIRVEFVANGCKETDENGNRKLFSGA